MLSRDEALQLVKENVSKENIVKHMLAVEAIMRSLAKHLSENENIWGLTGLLHDIDYEKTMDNPEKHGLVAEEILKGKVSEEILRAIKAHNFEHTGITPETRMEKALIACDAISGLLIACALVMPSKKLEDVKLKTVKKKFKDKDFARGADRKRILFCEEINVPKEEFFEIALNGLKQIASELGL
ncbi:HDIG domain-containing protein [Candidatus Bathyarchaeota archaeon]|nr:HDIG domain-containing protein [Candidatus Bathyarchaeota archaeon]